MAVRIETMAEPLPGYRLIERLGGGGFGEVWKAEAPGGLFKAIKFVYGDLSAAGDDPDGVRADQELKSLERVKEVRHVFILSLEQIQIVNGQLLIVTELADRTLWDRFRESKAHGHGGIPREELLRYLSDTAEALDFMNDKHQLQHLDIKPQNLFLVENHVKVADFGLVKALQGMLASVTGGVTPVYAAPETFEGKVSRYSDQYSLAIVYQELLTGQRPYTGTTLRQLVMQHCQGTPDLKALPEHDRPIVLRALAKDYDKRFSNCMDFVDALRRAGQQAGNSYPQQPAQAPGAQRPETSEPLTENGRPRALSEEREADTVTRRQGQSASPIVFKNPASDSSVEFTSETPSNHGEDQFTPSIGSKSKIDVKADGLLAPAVIVGLGALGMATMRHLRKELTENLGFPTSSAGIRMLYLDTDAETAQKATRGRDDVSLRASELMLMRLRRPSHYLKNRQGQTGLETWLPANLLYRMPRQQTPSGIRALGRLAFVDNYRLISRRLQLELEECCSKEALVKTARQTGLTPRVASPRVYIVAALGGGTGSGMLLDLAYLARSLLAQMGHQGSPVVGICFLPPAENEPRRTQELANTFAALQEINYFSKSNALFSARYDLGEVRAGQPVFTFKGPPLDRCVFHAMPGGRDVARPEERDVAGLGLSDSASETVSSAARIVFSDLLTQVGQAVEEKRNASRSGADIPGAKAPQDRPAGPEPIRFQVVGMHRIVWPRRRLLDRAADAACRRLVSRWITKDSKPLKAVVKELVAERWEQNELSAESVIERFHAHCEQAMGQPAEALFSTIIVPASQALLPLMNKSIVDPAVNLSAILDVVQQFESWVGVPDECRPHVPGSESSPPPLSQMEAALEGAAAGIVEQCEQKLAELAVGMIEDPQYRLAGAEEALRLLHGQIEKALQAHEQLAKELQQRSVMIYKRLQSLTEPSVASPNAPRTWRPPFSRRGSGSAPAATELLELLKAYPKCRYQWMILSRVTALYVSLRGGVSDQLRGVDYCRARLSELRELFRDPKADPSGVKEAPASGEYILADACTSLQQAVQGLDSSVNANDLVELDVRVQKLIRKQFKALVDVCYTPSAGVLRQLAPVMHAEARSFLRHRLGSASVNEIYLAQFQNDPDGSKLLQDHLGDVFDSAAPEVAASSPQSEINVFAVPSGDGEVDLREALNATLTGPSVVQAKSIDEIVVYREHTLATLADLKQMGPVGQEAYRKVCSQDDFTPHGRIDVSGWGPRDDDS